MQGAAAGEAQAGKCARGRFDEREAVARDQSTCGVIGGLAISTKCDGYTTERAGDVLCGAAGGVISFDGKNHVFELRGAAAAEGLHGVQRAGGDAAASQRCENVAIESAASVESDFCTIFFVSEIRERLGDVFERAIGSGDEEDVSRECIRR